MDWGKRYFRISFDDFSVRLNWDVRIWYMVSHRTICPCLRRCWSWKSPFKVISGSFSIIVMIYKIAGCLWMAKSDRMNRRHSWSLASLHSFHMPVGVCECVYLDLCVCVMKCESTTLFLYFRKFIFHFSFFNPRIMTLEEGDFLITGTPAGVGPMVTGQVVTAELWDSEKKTLLSEIQANVVPRKWSEWSEFSFIFQICFRLYTRERGGERLEG